MSTFNTLYSRLRNRWLKQRTRWWPVEQANLVKVSNCTQVIAAVQAARQHRHILRACGSQHSMQRAVFDPLTKARVVRIKLEGELRQIRRLAPGLYQVGGGCNFGIDGLDPSSTAANSFARQADADGYALPLLGGMSAQTVAGFMATGSAGGSVRYGLADCLERFEMVDGLGQLQVFTKGTPEFDAAAVAMGLFGIVINATFRLQARFLVEGTEQTVPYAQSMVRDGSAFLQACREHDYLHVLWLPNRGVENVLQFVGSQAPVHAPLEPYFHPLSSAWLNVAAHWVIRLANLALMRGYPLLLKQLLLLLNPNDARPRTFRDHWWRVLPNDDLAAINTWVRVQFTEIWIDIADADAVIATLRELFLTDELACGSFGIEIYAAKQSPFWMSMAYGRDVIRIDPYWLEYNSLGTLDEYFSRIWGPLLSKFPSARLHWGKHVPPFGQQFGTGNGQSARIMGTDYCRKSYPKFEAWLQKRAEYDPEQIFITDYWRTMLLDDTHAVNPQP